MMYIFRYSTTFRIWQCIYFLEYLVYIMESYVIRCPEQAEWNIRAEIQCQNTRKYFCLYNYVPYSYEEGCTGPDWDRPGSKRVYSRNFNRAPCNDTRYQPIKFVTNGNSDCIFRKSLCTEEGQTLFSNGTTRTDSTCRCDYTQGYAFVTVPRSKCYCRPSEEDCSCYLKKCQEIGYYLSADYECTKYVTKKTVCPLMSENASEDPHIDMVPSGTPREDDSYVIKRTCDVAILVSICLFLMIVITMYIMFQQKLPRYPYLSTEQISTVITMCIMLRQRLPRCPCLSTEQISAVITTCCIMLLQRLGRSRRLSTEETVEVHIELGRMDAGPSLDTVEQHVTNDEQDNEDQIALRELDENRKSAAEELKDSIQKEEIDAAFTHFNEIMDNWKNEPVKLAVTGKSGVGKSSFINAIRNLKTGDEGFTTTSSYGNTTKHATVFKYPGNPNITLHDLPGFGTTQFPKNEYEENMELHKYDYVLILVGNIEENDIEIAKKLKEMDKSFCFVRSKIDIDIENAKTDGELETEVIKKIKFKSLDILKHAGIKEARFFEISNRSRRIGHFNELVLYIQRNLPKLKCDALMFSLLGEFTDDIIDSKYQILKDRIWNVSLASAGPAATPVPGLDVVLNLALICKEIWLYHNTFGFGQQIVKEISKHDYLRKKLSDSSIIEIEAAKEAMQKFVIIQLGKLGTLMAVPSAFDLIFEFPIIGSLVSGLTAGKVTHNLLTRILDGCKDDAKLVYSHLMNVNAQK